MANDARSTQPTDDLPQAQEAFETPGSERRRDASFAVSRAGALLTLVEPSRPEPGSNLVDEEAREILGVTPIRPVSIESNEAPSVLADLGDLGLVAARLMTRIDEKEEPDALRQFAASLSQFRYRASADERADPIDAVQRELAADVFGASVSREGRREPAFRLVVASLLDEDALVRVAAAGAMLRVDAKDPFAEAILDVEGRDTTSEIGELARAVRVNARGYDDRRIEVETARAGSPPSDGGFDSALVHGTWARWGRWWKPTGDLHQFLRDEKVFPKLYTGADGFAWSGYYSFRNLVFATKDWSRLQAGSHLAWWAERKLEAPPDLVGHSYGGSISMLATQVEKQVRGLVLLSPAVHQTCLPDPQFYEQILMVRMKLDLVLLADRSKPQLLRNLHAVIEKVIPRRGLVGHAPTHDPSVWRKNRLDAYVRDEWLTMNKP